VGGRRKAFPIGENKHAKKKLTTRKTKNLPNRHNGCGWRRDSQQQKRLRKEKEKKRKQRKL
jgi:hypothetical protein